MTCTARFIIVIAYFVAYHLLLALIGLLLSKFSLRRHPWLHRVGLFFMAMSIFTCDNTLPRRCELCCGVDKCRNWTCPGQNAYAKNPRE